MSLPEGWKETKHGFKYVRGEGGAITAYNSRTRQMEPTGDISYPYEATFNVGHKGLAVTIEDDDATYTSGSYCTAEIPFDVLQSLYNLACRRNPKLQSVAEKGPTDDRV